MTTEALLSPSRTVSVAGKPYTLDGSFGTLRAVQEAFGRDIVQVLISILDMRLDEIAKLIALGAGKPADADAIGQAIIDELGPLEPAYATLKTELVAWLNVALSPKSEREKKRAEMEQVIRVQTSALSASPGPSTSGPPSVL